MLEEQADNDLTDLQVLIFFLYLSFWSFEIIILMVLTPSPQYETPISIREDSFWAVLKVSYPEANE